MSEWKKKTAVCAIVSFIVFHRNSVAKQVQKGDRMHAEQAVRKISSGDIQCSHA